MQAKRISEHELVKACMAELCKKEGFADCESLVQRDLKFLCDRIEAETGVLISLSTIKRLLNGQFSNIPQIATLDAIAVSAGYQNWQSYKLNKSRGAGTPGKDEINRNGTNPSPRKILSTPGLLVLCSILVLIILGLLALMRSGKSNIEHADKAQFSAAKVTGNDLPNTVVFKYNIDSVNADSFFIQQSWDKHRKVAINKHNYTLTDIYYEPGYHVAKLIANEKIIKTVDVSIPTDRWFFYAKERAPKSTPKYILSTKGTRDGSMQLIKDDLLSAKIDIQRKNDFLQVYFPSKIASSSDNFVLKFRIKVNVLNNNLCPYFMSEVYCQKYFMYFISTPKGCTSELSAQFGDNYLNGKTNDLSSLGSNVTVWQNVEFAVKNKNASISINGVKTFSAIYQQSAGLITGIGFISNGLCQVDFVDLKTTDGKNIYTNDFEH